MKMIQYNSSLFRMPFSIKADSIYFIMDIPYPVLPSGLLVVANERLLSLIIVLLVIPGPTHTNQVPPDAPTRCPHIVAAVSNLITS